MELQDAIKLSHLNFLREDHLYGCAETVFMVFKEVYNLPDPYLASPAMVFNGGIAGSVIVCSSISRATMAMGILAEKHIIDHIVAKKVARIISYRLIQEFERKFRSVICRDLTGYDFQDEIAHDKYFASNIWRTDCVAQIEYVIAEMY